jgi:electron transfer flavoprotein alpha subunit
MSGILVYSEVEQTALGLLTRGRDLAAELGKPLTVALLGEEAGGWADACFAHGAQRAYVGNDPDMIVFQAGTYAAALTQIVAQAEADIILMGSTRRGRELAPRLAQKLSAGCVTDAIGLSLQDGRLVAERRALGGNTVSAEVITSPQQVIAVMPKLFDAEPLGLSLGTKPSGAGAGEVIEVALTLEPPATRLVERRPKEAGAVNVEEAELLVCIGRALKEESDLAMIQNLADVLSGVVGCTRAVSHEYHWLSEDQMIGLSGKASSPRLYVGIGISGQIQHTVGILDSKVIVAINNDKNAPIFKIADYGIVGDLYRVVPRLIEQLQSGVGE